MLTPLFRVKRYAHPKYKFLARGKVNGKWRRRYFRTEAEAIAFARQQNAGSQSTEKDRPERPRKRAKSKHAPNASPVRGHETADYADNSFARLNEPTYTGPYIQRYFGDHWSMHLPFAYDLMREFRPKVFVELGVWKGESYFSFCQSAADHRIPTQCYGIDTWRGDVHMGDFDPELGIEVAEYNWRYSSFSELRTTTFAEAVDEFADGTIDLLHIDGAHTYEDVNRDFKAWLPKLSAKGIVLLHDVAVHDGGFGVWRLWEEIAKPGQSFLFEFGYGLGVWKKVPVVNSDSAWLRRLFELNHVEQKRINAYYVTAAAALALWHKTQDRKNRDEMAKPLPVQVFVDQGGSFSETSSMTAELVPGRWQSIRFDHLEKLGPKRRGRIRLDPVNCLAFVNISSIRLITDSDKRVFYSASSAADFAQINVSEGMLKHETDGMLELVATDSDPQVFLPELNFPSSDSWHLEVDLEVHTAPSNIILRQKETFASLAEIRNVEQQKNIAEQELKQRDATIAANNAELQRLNAEIERISSAIHRSEEELKQHKRNIEYQQAEIRDLKTSVQSERIQLAAKRSQNAELTDKLLKLDQNVKTFAEVFGLTRQGLQDSNSAAAVLIQSLFHDIRLIRKRKSLWKACRLFRSTLSREGTHDIPSSPKVTAEALKQRLQGIQRTLKSKKTSPAMALSAMAELIALQNQAHQVLASLRARSLLRLQQKTVTTSEPVSHLPASKFSPLFDAEWYLAINPEVKKTGMDPLQHYLSYGAQEGRDPHPLFDAKWYLSQKPELPQVGLTALEHYVSHGAREGCSPHPEFDSQFYIKNHPESVVGDTTPLAHYLTVGWRLGYRPNPRFDPHFYLRAYPDVAAANIEPLTHFVLQGRTEGRKTNEEKFSFEAYRPAFDIPREPIVSADSSLVPTVKAIAFYLPQFHPIPENDRWWGEGFTDWINVRAGRPSFPGHYQPHVPTELGYYDLRETQVLQKQTELAKAYGIYGFCFYYYWFGGKVLLDLPIRRMLESGKPDFPFCICWANENWTRRWDGREDDVLIAQSHSPEDDVNFIRRVENALLQKNYIRVRGKPLLLVYRPSLFPDSLATTERWRDYFRRKGHGELHLVMVRSFHDQTAPEVYGFDAAVQFPPHFPTPTITSLIAGKEEKFKGTIYDYTDLRSLALEQLITASSTVKTYATVVPSWDNTARRGSQATIFANSSPEAYYEWLSATVEQVQKKEVSDERLIFINAWNEWAEGAHLEPDERYRYAWLNATRLALETGGSRPDPAGKSNEPYVLVISHDACLAGAQVLLLNLLRQWKKRRPFAVRVICVGTGELRKEFEKCFPTLVLADFVAKAEQDYAFAEFLKGSPRVIYSSTVLNGPLLAQLRPLGAKIVTHAHELQKSIERWAPGEIMAATLKHSAFFLAGSGKVAENLSASHGVPKDRLGVVYDFIEPWGEEQQPDAAAKAAMREEFGTGVEDVVVFGCGTTDWRKGPDLFVEIARSACARDSRLKFVWIGGDPAPLMEKVRSLGLEGRVLFVGNRRESRRYYYTGHIFLLSSREDPCPLVALEAADAGLPIVCFAGAGDIPGFVGDECGSAVPYEDVPAAAQAVVRLAGDDQLRRNQGAEARRRAVERHSSAGAALQIEALFDRLAPELQPVSTRAKSREEEPLVSVIVPNYNHEKYLPERLRSITGQTYKNMEIILLDDASTDNSRAILQKFASNENRARFVPNTQNSGSTFKQWRKGLSQARGKYVWLAESDDTAEPAFLETLVGKLEANPGLSLAYCQLQMVSPNGEKLGTPEQPWLSEIDPLRWNTDFVNDGIDEIRRSLLVKNTILNASGVVFRNAEGIADLVNDTMRLCADWLFWMRLLQRGGVAYIAKPLSRWRLQSSNARKRPPGELEWLEGERVLVEAVEILKLTQPERDRILLDFLRKCWKWRIEAVSNARAPNATGVDATSVVVFQNEGWCPICEARVTFSARNSWFRDHYLCDRCGSIPRERALMHVIQTRYPKWRDLTIHESSPGNRGASVKLAQQCRSYTASQYDPQLGFGNTHPNAGYRSENLENQTFPDEAFDLIVTQDVFEHVFDAPAAFMEIARTLRRGGAHIFTTPLVNKDKPSERRASLSDGGIVYHHPPEYHENPMSTEASLVTWHWGEDIVTHIKNASGLDTQVVALDDLKMGIRAEYIEVLVTTRPIEAE